MKKLMILALVGSLATTTHARPTAASIGAGITAGAVAMGAMLKISYDTFKKTNPDSKMSLREYVIDFAKKNPEWVALYAASSTVTGVVAGFATQRFMSNAPTTSTQGQSGTATSPDASTPSNATDTSDTSSATATSTTATSEIPTSSTAPAESTGNTDQNTETEDQQLIQKAAAEQAALEERKKALTEAERLRLEEQTRQMEVHNAKIAAEAARHKKANERSSTDASATTTTDTPADPKAPATTDTATATDSSPTAGTDTPTSGTETAPATTDPKTTDVVADPAATPNPAETSTATTVPTSTPLPRSKSSSTVAKPGDPKRNASTPDLRRPTYSKDAEMKTLAALAAQRSQAPRKLNDATSTTADKIATEIAKPNVLLGLFGSQPDQCKKDIAFYRAYSYLSSLGKSTSYSNEEIARATACAEAAVALEIKDKEKAADLLNRMLNATPTEVAQHDQYITNLNAFGRLLQGKVAAIESTKRAEINSLLTTLEVTCNKKPLKLEALITAQKQEKQELFRNVLVFALHSRKEKNATAKEKALKNAAASALNNLTAALSKQLPQESEAAVFKAVFGVDA